MTDPTPDRELIGKVRATRYPDLNLIRTLADRLEAVLEDAADLVSIDSEFIHRLNAQITTLTARLERVKEFSRDMLEPHGETGVVVAARVREHLTAILTDKEA